MHNERLKKRHAEILKFYRSETLTYKIDSNVCKQNGNRRRELIMLFLSNS